MSRRPLRAASLAFVSGVALGGWLPHEPFAWGCATAATLACSAALLAIRRGAAAFTAALLLFGCAGIFRVQAELIPLFAGRGRLVEGDAVAAGRLGRPVERRPGELLLHLEDVRIRRDGSTVRLVRPIQVVVAAGGLDLSVGDLVTARGRLRAIRGDRNFGWFPAPVPPRGRRYQMRLAVASAAWISSEPGCPGRGPSAAVLRWRAAADGFWQARGGAAAGILDALTTGERGGIPAQVQESFLRSGLTHLLAISGMNVAFLVAVVFLVLRRTLAVFESLALRCPVQLLAAALSLPALWFFVLFSGSQIPVARAGVSGAAALAAVLLWRRSGPVDLWTLAAFVLVAADPFVLYSASFQLSFGAVGALMLVAGGPASPADQEGGASWTTRWYGRARSLFVVSLAASAVTAPLVAFHFQQVSLVGPLANLFAVPFAGVVVLPAGWAALGAQALGVPGADALTAAALWSADRLVDVANWFAAPPWAVVSTARPSPLLTAGLVGLCAAFAHGALAWTWTRFVACAGCAAAASAWVLATHWPTMLVTFLDVGQGLSVAAILPGGSSLLFDAGPRWRGYDAGERVVVPALRRLGVFRLDTLAISHGHPDHEGGAEAVTRQLGPRRLWRGSGPGALREGEDPRVPGGVRALVLNPGAVRAGSGRADADENDRSLGLMLTLGGTGVVLTGDAGPGVAGHLATAAVGAAPRVALQAPHHGGSPPACALLAAALKPEVSVISVGRNTYGHPRPGAIAALAAAGRVLRTDDEGAVHVRSDGTRLIVRTWREGAQRRTWAERLRWLVAGW